MKNFFSKLLASISSTEYYHTVIYRPFHEVAIFYLVFLILISGIYTVQYWLQVLPQYKNGVAEILQETEKHFPSDLTLTWSGTELNTSHQPLVVAFPQAAPQSVKEMADYLVVVTSENTPTPSQTSLFITSPTTIYTLNQGTLDSVGSLQDILGNESFEVTKDNLQLYTEKIQNVSNDVLTATGYLFPIGMVFFLSITSLYILLIDTLIIFLFIKIQRIALSYHQLLQLGLALLVPAQIIELVTKLAQLDTQVSMLSLSFWILFIVVFFSLQKKLTT